MGSLVCLRSLKDLGGIVGVFAAVVDVVVVANGEVVDEQIEAKDGRLCR